MRLPHRSQSRHHSQKVTGSSLSERKSTFWLYSSCRTSRRSCEKRSAIPLKISVARCGGRRQRRLAAPHRSISDCREQLSWEWLENNANTITSVVLIAIGVVAFIGL